MSSYRGLQLASPNSSWAVKRALYNLDGVPDQDHRAKLTQGLKDAVIIAAKTLEKMDEPRHTAKLNFWFGNEHSGANGRELVRQVYKNFVGDNTDGTGADNNGKVIVDATDYWIPKQGQMQDADGKTPFCALKTPDGKTASAYYKTRAGKTPGMHFCNKVWSREDLASLTADRCSKLGDQVSTAIWTKNFIGANVLHEFM
jgi:hypothetical protein